MAAWWFWRYLSGSLGRKSSWAVSLPMVMGAVIYFPVVLALKGLSRQELRFFAGFVKDNLRRIGLFRGQN